MRVKKWLALVLALMMTVMLFTGCNNSDSGSTPDEKTTDSVGTDPFYGEGFDANGKERTIKLKVWTPEESKTLVQKQCDAFIAKYPDHDIKIEIVAQSEFNAAANIKTAAEKGADVFHFASDQLNGLVQQGLVVEVFEQANDVVGISVEDIINENTETSVKGATIDGKLYAYPSTGDNGYVLVYDKRVISDEQAKTWEGILEACKAANKTFMMDAGGGFYACMFAFTGGVDIEGLKKDENGDETQKFNNYDKEKAIDTIQAFADLFINKYSNQFKSASVVDVVANVEDGKCAAGIDGSWNAVAYADALGENMGVTTLPTINVKGEAVQTRGIMGFKFWGVNAATKFKEASQLLAAHLASYECQLERAQELFWGPSNKKAIEDDSVKAMPFVSALLAQSEFSVPMVNIHPVFWSGFEAMGAKLHGDNPYDRESIKVLFEKTMKMIDEG